MFKDVVKNVEMAVFSAAVQGIVHYHAYHLRLLTTYGAIADALEKPPAGAQLAHALQYITEHEVKQGKVPSTIVVVNSHTSIPGSGLFNQLRALGHEIGDGPDDDRQYWLKLLLKLRIAPYTLEMLVQPDGDIKIPREFVMGAHGPKTAGNFEAEIVSRAREFARPTNIRPAPSQVNTPRPATDPGVLQSCLKRVQVLKDMAALKRELEQARRDPDFICVRGEVKADPDEGAPGSRLPGAD